MTFVSIAWKNIQKKFGNYISYFVSMIISVLIFCLFCSLYFNPAFEKYRFGIGKMNVLFRGAAVAVLLFSIVFVMYSNGYFIKIQKKEIAIYSLLGMRKEQIARMMFMETFFIGVLAIICGTILGVLSAGFFTSLLMRMMAVGTRVTFSLDVKAVILTGIAFIMLFILSGLISYRTIYQYTLIELLSSGKQSEGIPAYSKRGAAISVGLLGFGYLLSGIINVDTAASKMVIPVLGVAACILTGTFLLFRNFVPLLMAAISKRKTFYYRISNFISVSQIAFRLMANSRMLSVIALLTAITITMLSASFSFYRILGGDATRAYAPFSYLVKNITQEQYQKIRETISRIGEVSIVSEDKLELLPATIQSERYAVKDQQTGEAVVGKPAEGYVMSQSAYLQLISETKTAFGTYAETKSDFVGGLEDTTCYFIDGNAVSDYCENLIGEKVNIDVQGEQSSFVVIGAGLHKYIGALDLYKHPTVVVSDAIYQQYYGLTASEKIDTFYGFQFNDDMMSGQTVEAMEAFIPARFHIGGLPENISYIGVYKANFSLFGSYAFIGFFFGILFLLASVSVLYYKLIMEAQEEIPRFSILRKTGMNQKEILCAVIKQLGMVYGFPLLVGLMHTLFGLLLYNRTLGAVGQQTPTLANAAMMVILYVVVYCVFYLLSVRKYDCIVSKKN